MKGIMGLPDFIVPQVKAPNTMSNTRGIGEKISFGNFFQRWIKDGSNANADVSSDQTETNLLLKSLEKLLDFCILLRGKQGIQGDKQGDLDLQELLTQINLDFEFVSNLPEHLREFFLKFKDKNSFEAISAKDIQAKDELIQRWLKHQEKKQKELLVEVYALIATIQDKLLQGEGSGAKNLTDKGDKELREMSLSDLRALQDRLTKIQEDISSVSDKAKVKLEELPVELRSKIEQYMNQQQSNENGEELTVSQRLALVGKPMVQKEQNTTKSLLDRVSKFITKAETVTKQGITAPLADLKTDLQAYFESNRQSRFRTDQLGRNQYIALRDVVDADVSQRSQTTLREALSEITEKGLKSDGEADPKFASAIDQHDNGSDDGKGANLDWMMATDIQKDSIKTGQTSTVRTQAFYLPQTDDIIQQMIESFKLEIKQGISEMEMRLHPEELGRLVLKLTMEDGVVNARFIAESRHVKELIEQNLPHLQESMNKEGVHWEKVTVDVGHDGLRENPFMYQGDQNLKDNRQNRSDQNSGDFDVDFEDVELAATEIGRVKKDPNRLVDYMA